MLRQMLVRDLPISLIRRPGTGAGVYQSGPWTVLGFDTVTLTPEAEEWLKENLQEPWGVYAQRTTMDCGGGAPLTIFLPKIELTSERDAVAFKMRWE